MFIFIFVRFFNIFIKHFYPNSILEFHVCVKLVNVCFVEIHRVLFPLLCIINRSWFGQVFFHSLISACLTSSCMFACCLACSLFDVFPS